ncbi:MAG TPA: hypothetical protein VGB55_06565, partial [Tepidisphaeraceae bacterium]
MLAVAGDLGMWIRLGVTGGLVGLALAIRYFTSKPKEKNAETSLDGPPIVPIHPIVLPRPVGRPLYSGPVETVTPIDMVRELLGPPPRVFPSNLETYVHADPPSWLMGRKDDDMLHAFKHQERIRRDGRVVWAAIVQSNVLNFAPGAVDSPASVVWSDDPHYDTHPHELAGIGTELYELKGTDQADPESATFARMLANELIRAPRLKVPSRFTEGRAVYHSSVMMTRRHLPQGYVTRNLIPVWADPEPTGSLLIVPAAYWSASLTSWWKNVAG